MPFYGTDGQGGLLRYYLFTRYVKVTVYQGDSLRPVPLGEGKDLCRNDLYEIDSDDKQIAEWSGQAAASSGLDGS